MRELDRYERQAIVDNIEQVYRYATFGDIQRTPDTRLITKGRREYLTILYRRADDPFYLELSRKECAGIASASEWTP